MYNIFPKELWILIISDLPYKYIRKFYDINDISKCLCDDENIIDISIIKG